MQTILNPFEAIQKELEEIKKAVKELSEKEQKTTEPNTLVDRKELSEMFGVNPSTIWRWQKKGILNPKGIGGRVYFDRAEVMNAVKNLK